MIKIQSLQQLAQAIQEERIISWAIKNPVKFLRLAPSLRGGIESRRNRRNPAVDLSSVITQLQETYDSIASSVASEQAVNAIQHEIECETYTSIYRLEEPYLRLHLRPIAVWLKTKNGGEERQAGDFNEGMYANATLLLHQSGVTQITIAIRFPDRVTTQKLEEMQFGGANIISAAELPESLLRAAMGERKFRRNPPGTAVDDERAGTNWRRFCYSDPISVSDICQMYIDAISKIAIRDLPGAWFCHPSIFLEEITCCDSEEDFRATHHDDLTKFVTRYSGRHPQRGSAVEDLAPQDTSLTVDHSVYMDASHTVSIRWPGFPGVEDYANHLSHVLIAECALLQYWQIRMIDQRVNSNRGTLKSIKALQEDAIFGLREYRNSPLTHGTARDAAEYLLQGLQADRLYGHALESLNQLQQLVSTGDSQRSTRRANTLAATAALAAVTLGLPAVDQTLDIAQKVPEKGFLGSLAEPLRGLAEQGEMGTWKGFLALMLTVTMLVLTRNYLKRGKARTRRRRRKAGIAWPLGTIEILRNEPEDDRA
ncbi:hypothetical protein ACFYT4_06255 [Streptomyces sp. NPDC004609]|uniref:hypothetical protein n=1 Tax=Streptomyces sp. NPDC004609 TaxID=3364704 RepID=UPI0036C25787